MNTETKTTADTRERDIFIEALGKSAPGECAAFLDVACGGDSALRERVEALLREDQAAGSFLLEPALKHTPALSRPTTGPDGTTQSAGVSEKAGERIGRYRLLQQIGEGGCGIVFMAEQEEPVRRRVALKVIKLGMDTRSVIARFEAERQALAMMDHENIAKVLDAGATDTGRPYFVMELVRGIRITDYCDQHRLSPRDRLSLFIQVCQAVQHAHQKGIIHRDLKPSNILVTVNDGVPVPKVIDFGIAKATEQRLTEKTLFTEFTAFIGTPAYMSPEQAEMSSLDIDTRGDIYSLGVLLYELLTGRTPFDGATLMRNGLDECRRTIREKEPDRPSTRLGALQAADLTTTANQRCTDAPRLIHLLRGDLDWIVMKCLEKDRTRRYATANALALDIQRYVDDEPVLARPPSNIYRFQKLLRRHRLVVGAVSGIAISLIAGVTLSIWQAIRATRAEGLALASQQQESVLRRQAELEKAAARQNEYIADMGLAQQSIAAGNYGRAAQLVEKHLPRPGERDLRGFEWRYLWQLCRGDEHTALPTQEGSVTALIVSPDGRFAATGLREQLTIHELATQTLVARLPKGAMSMAFTPDGKALVSASRAAVRIWRTSDWTERTALPEAFGPIALSRDGRLLATQGPGRMRIWDTATWQEIRSIPGAYGPALFSPDGTRLATDSRDGITLWPLQAQRSEVVLQDSTNLFLRAGPSFSSDRGMAFTADGRSLIAARNSASARGVFVLSFWDTMTGKEMAVMPDDPERSEHVGAIAAMALSPDGQTLATGSFDHSIRLWDLASRRTIGTLQGHRNEVWGLAFSPDGRHLLSGSKDGGVNLWPTRPQAKEELLPEGWTPVAFSANGRTLAALNTTNSLALFNLATREAEQQFQLATVRPDFGGPPQWFRGTRPEPDQPRPGGPPGERREPRPDGQGPRPESEGRGPGRGGFGSPGFGSGPSFALSGDLRTLVVGQADGTAQFWDTDTREMSAFPIPGGRTDYLALSPDGRTLITGGFGQSLRWWTPQTTTNVVLTLEGYRPTFSPDGRTLVTFQQGNKIQVWEVAAHALRTNLTIEPSSGFTAALSVDGRLLATTAGMEDFDNAVYLWNLRTGKLVGTCVGHKQPVIGVAFAPDGKTLATSGSDSMVKLWNVETQQELLSERRPGSTPRSLLFSPDGRLLVGFGGFFAPSSGLRLFRAPTLADIDAHPASPPRRGQSR